MENAMIPDRIGEQDIKHERDRWPVLDFYRGHFI